MVSLLLPKIPLRLAPGITPGIHHVYFLPLNDKRSRRFLLGLFILINVINLVIAL